MVLQVERHNGSSRGAKTRLLPACHRSIYTFCAFFMYCRRGEEGVVCCLLSVGSVGQRRSGQGRAGGQRGRVACLTLFVVSRGLYTLVALWNACVRKS